MKRVRVPPASRVWLHLDQGPSVMYDCVHAPCVIRVVAQFVRRVWDLCVKRVGAPFVIKGASLVVRPGFNLVRKILEKGT